MPTNANEPSTNEPLKAGYYWLLPNGAKLPARVARYFPERGVFSFYIFVCDPTETFDIENLRKLMRAYEGRIELDQHVARLMKSYEFLHKDFDTAVAMVRVIS